MQRSGRRRDARTGLGFTQSLYERERFEEVLHIAADIKAAAVELEEDAEVHRETDHFVQEWLESIGEGVPGYVTPKVAIGAIVGNGKGELLLVQRADSGIWLYPTGWADVGYSPAEVAVAWVLGHQRMAVSSRVATLPAVGDPVVVYTTRGAFKNPTRDRAEVIALGTVADTPVVKAVTVAALQSGSSSA